MDRPGSAGLGATGRRRCDLPAPGEPGAGRPRRRRPALGNRPDGVNIDVDGLLARVGLAGFAERETSTRSGGELQRLAVAGLLARRPSMVISDESTAMLDPAGRADVLELMRGPVRDDGVTIVHISHTDEVTADQTLDLGDDRPSPAPAAGEGSWRSVGASEGPASRSAGPISSTTRAHPAAPGL